MGRAGVRTIEDYDNGALIAARVKLGWTQKKVSEEMNRIRFSGQEDPNEGPRCSVSTVQNLEAGKSAFVSTLKECCKALQIDYEAIRPAQPMNFLAPIRVEVTRGVQFRAAMPHTRENWQDSPAVIVVSAVKIITNPDEPSSVIQVHRLTLNSDDFGHLFQVPMQATHIVVTAKPGGELQPADVNETVSFSIPVGEIWESEVLFQAKRLSQTYRKFAKELRDGSLSGREVSLTLSIDYSSSKGPTVAHYPFRLRSSEIKQLLDIKWDKPPHGMPWLIQVGSVDS